MTANELPKAAAWFVMILLIPGRAWAVGGEDCTTATVIAGLPFVDADNTCWFNDDYDEHCFNPSTSADAVYEYTSPIDQCVDVSLCAATAYDAKIFVYASDAGGCPATGSGETILDIMCREDGCPAPANLVPEILGLHLNAGVTYWFVVDGAAGLCGAYQIVINGTACPPPAPCVTDPECCDGYYCNGAEICAEDPIPGGGFTCQSGTPVDCDDGDPCTEDSCDEATDGCLNTWITGCCTTDGDCNDGNPCTDDACDTGQGCSIGTCENIQSADGTPCGSQSGTDCDNPDTCDLAGICQDNLEPDSTPCDDGSLCTVGEACTGGACGGGTPLGCDDADPCTTDECDEYADDGGCLHSPIDGCCQLPEDCDDGDECTDDVCFENACANPISTPGTPCGSQSATACTAPNTCDQTGTCLPNDINEGGGCDDGDACTDGDICVLGSCVGTLSGICETCAQGGDPTNPRNQLSFQAVLKDDQGNPVQGSVDLTFRFYDLLGTQIGEPVVVPCPGLTCEIGSSGDGLISARIPIDAAIFAEFGGHEIGVSVGTGPELQPRIPLTSAPHAFRVNCADGEEVVDHLALGGAGNAGALQIFGPGAPGRDVGDLVGSISADKDRSGLGGACGKLYFKGGALWETVELSACEVVEPPSALEGTPLGGVLRLRNAGGAEDIVLSGGLAGWRGAMTMYDTSGDVGLHLAHDRIHFKRSAGQTTALLRSSGAGGSLAIYNGAGAVGAILDAKHNNGGRILIKDSDGNTRLSLEGDHQGTTGDNAGLIHVYNGTGAKTVSIFGDYQNTGDGRVVTQELQITGGSDLSEQFDIDGLGADVRPGMVVSLDPQHPGKLMVSVGAYDRRVAGIISGAGGVKPGLWMGQTGSVADGQHPVALTGRVYCWVDASYGSIEVGDMLTTSDTPGHAMKVTRHMRAQGAIIGKAMTSLEEGRGLVLVLVSLQ